MNENIIIIGAGLSGLLTGYRLKKEGIDFQILEARNRIGGRIQTVNGHYGTPIEMGATWFGAQHRNLKSLLKELHLSYFPQYNGDFYYFYEPGSPRDGSYPLDTHADSYRLVNGSASIVKRLANLVGEENILLDTKVKSIALNDDQVVIRTANANPFIAKKVIITVPPKVWAYSIDFYPQLPVELLEIAKATQTWMEDATKVAIEYSSPFWKAQKMPGIILSNEGPFIECYDQTNKEETGFALCGFLNPSFNKFSRATKIEAVKKQLVKILGKEAGNSIGYFEHLWQNDPFTKVKQGNANYPHQNNGNQIFRKQYFNGKMIFSGSETASSYAGYMEGAVVSSETAIKQIFSRVDGREPQAQGVRLTPPSDIGQLHKNDR